MPTFDFVIGADVTGYYSTDADTEAEAREEVENLLNGGVAPESVIDWQHYDDLLIVGVEEAS